MTHRLIRNICLAAIMMLASGCSDSLTEWWDNVGIPDMEGEPIVFTSHLPAQMTPSTRGETTEPTTTVDNDLLQAYKPVSQLYEFNISIYEKEKDEPLDTRIYCPSIGSNTNGDLYYQSGKPLYWPGNAKEYGFKAVAGTAELNGAQTSMTEWLKQDRIEGFGFMPLVQTTGEGENTQTQRDNIDGLNYRTNKQWYLANKKWKELDALGTMFSSDEYKKVPLFLQHRRALVTVILKAGEGVNRSDVLAENAAHTVTTKIYSYGETGVPLEVSPLQGKAIVDYEAEGTNPAETGVEVARYDAIVMPHDYAAGSAASEEKIVAINVSNQNFSFYASNDSRYGKTPGEDDFTQEMQDAFNEAYNLKAGDNLVITATLSRDSRKTLITAYIQPWTDVITSYVCDDFGTTGDPILIPDKTTFQSFLASEQNAAGNVAVVTASTIDLTADGGWDPNSYQINAILNLGNNTLITDNRLVQEITASGSLINGTVKMKKSSHDVEAVICRDNKGQIDHVNIVSDTDGERPVVTRAAMAVTNYGYISNCTSNVRVEGKAAAGETTTFIGGIAAISKSDQGTVLPVINACTVNARVCAADGQNNVCGGGIVGAADGYVIGNTFEYGVTLNQVKTQIRNIIHTKQGRYALYANDNSWPTVIQNTPANGEELTNNWTGDKYDEVIDSHSELKALVKANSSHNEQGKSYRLSDNFSVKTTDWQLGVKRDNLDNSVWGNVLFTLDGNGKTITLVGDDYVTYKQKKEDADGRRYLTAPMLFCNIMGTVKNLRIDITESLYGGPVYNESADDKGNASQDICAPLGYAVMGGTVSNVEVHAVPKKDGEGKTVYPKIVAAIPAGLVVWACNGATIENCVSDIDVVMKLANDVNTATTFFAGGLVAQAARATISQCKYVPRFDYAFTCHKEDTPRYESEHIFFGGIVGGTVVKDFEGNTANSDNPELVIADCSSWYEKTRVTYGAENETDPTIETSKIKRGSVIGMTTFTESDNKNAEGLKSGECQGNWWPNAAKAVADVVNTDEKKIGKRNSVDPEKPTWTN